eukprot:2667213-Prymnesium_polylepis.1
MAWFENSSAIDRGTVPELKSDEIWDLRILGYPVRYRDVFDFVLETARKSTTHIGLSRHGRLNLRSYPTL